LLFFLEIFRESRYYAKFISGIGMLTAIHVVGTVVYLHFGAPSTVDALYMTFMTVSTIGFMEIPDLSHSPGGRIFTMAVAFVGIGSTWYLFSTFTAFVLETNLNQAYKRRRVMRTIDGLRDHYIVCGIGRVGSYVADELLATRRSFVVIDTGAAAIEEHGERTGHELAVHGDAADDEVLARAGIARCAGVFAVTGDDSRNLVVSMSARALRPSARIVARVHDRRNVEKTRRAGADEIVSPDFTGGMRIASAMLRPHAVNFMDMMLRTSENFRVEEIGVPAGYAGSTVEAFGRSRDFLVVAVRGSGGEWDFNPDPQDRVEGGAAVIAIVTPEGRERIETALAQASPARPVPA
jgi:voltage-gated potassium channel